MKTLDKLYLTVPFVGIKYYFTLWYVHQEEQESISNNQGKLLDLDRTPMGYRSLEDGEDDWIIYCFNKKKETRKMFTCVNFVKQCYSEFIRDVRDLKKYLCGTFV